MYTTQNLFIYKAFILHTLNFFKIYVNEKSVINSFMSVNIKSLAGEGFDPPTFGLWAQHAASAPTRFTNFLFDRFQFKLTF